MTIALASIAVFVSSIVPNHLIGAGVFSLILGMLINPLLSKFPGADNGISFVSKKLLKLSIILMGITLSFSQIFEVGKYSLIVMFFTLFAAFGCGYILGKALGLNWKLSGLISSGTGICGGSAIAAIAPIIEADNKDIAYAISATFIFDVIMILLFPIMGTMLGMSDMGFGLWSGTAINDTSSVVAAAYAFSDAAGRYAVIVKLTRTLSIIPTVIIFSYINQKLKRRDLQTTGSAKPNTNIKNIFPYFILMFLVMVGIRSTGIISDNVSSAASEISKFLMIMSLGAIGLKTNIKEVSQSGFKPMLHGFLISTLVVIVSLVVQFFLGQV